MKKLFCVLVALLMALSAVGCGKDSPTTETANAESCDVDLTQLSSTMVYSEVYNMMTTPDDYRGKTVKMSGNFAIYQDQITGQIYFACVIADATACCSQGLEFVLEGDHTYPDDYPELNSVITVTGVFDTYEENGNIYCQLIHAKMET